MEVPEVRACIGIGFIIKPEDYPKDIDREWIKKILDSPYYRPVNDFNGDGDFFGIIIRTALLGEIIQINEELTDYVNYSEIPYVKEQYYEFFPNCADRKPEFYLMCEEVY